MGKDRSRIGTGAPRLTLGAVLAYLLVLQGLIAGYAQSAMAADANGPAFVICSPLGTADVEEGHPLADLGRECCSTLCQSACAVGPGVPGNGGPVLHAPATCGMPAILSAGAPAHPADHGLSPDARAPPFISA